MFKGFKKAVKGGFSQVTEQGTSLAGKVAGESLDLKDKLTSEAKRTIKGGVEYVAEGQQKVKETPAEEYKERTKEVAHKVKHYGALGEEYLGYSDPSKDLRKAVKAKEKAAKKAKKEKKKKGIKEEDLFSPENLAKFKKELEERRRLAALAEEVSPQPTGEGHKREDGEEEQEQAENNENQETTGGGANREGLQLNLAGAAVPLAWSNEASPEFGPPVEDTLEAQSPGATEAVSPGKTPRDEDEGWKRFTELTSGIDQLLKEKQDKLEEIKSSSYYQRKKTQVEILEDSKVERSKNLVGKRIKQWVDLDEEGFEEKEGVVAGEDVSPVSSEDEQEKEDEGQDLLLVEDPQGSTDEPDKPEGYVDIPEDETSDQEDDEDDLFNTAFAEAVVSGDIKLNVIPDSPEPAEDDDDPFNTKFAQDIVEKHEKDKKHREKVESNKVKFGSIAAAADVLTGKSDKVDKHSVDHAVKKKRRRANRINLIAEELDDVTALDDIEGVDTAKVEEREKEVDQLVDIFGGDDSLEVPVADLLSSSAASPVPSQQTDKSPGDSVDAKKQKLSDDLKEFDVVQQEEEGALTSNLAILAAEFNTAPALQEDEEEDPFDEAFDILAKESINKFALQDIEKDLQDEDLFDTSKADLVLNFASIAKVKEEEKEEEILDDFEDKDPFDTSAYEHLTKDVEEDLQFDSLAKRDPHETVSGSALDSETGVDPFEVVDRQLSSQTSTEEGSSWADFGGDKPKKKPPARPPPPKRPARPPPPPKSEATPRVEIDYASGRNTPSVIIKAPSSESIKSWNNAQAETLIRKSTIEAIEASVIEQEKDFDPFDTSDYNQVVDDIKAKENAPFDTSAIVDKEKLKLIEGELIDSTTGEVVKTDKSNQKILEELEAEKQLDDSVDPFDTGFVSDIVKESSEDPFDTSKVEGAEKEEDSDFDPFDTTAAEKVVPVRKPKVNQRSTVSIEDDDFDPESSFKVKQTRRPPPPPPGQAVDPFAVVDSVVESIPEGGVLKPESGGPPAISPQVSTEEKKNQELKGLEEELIGGTLKRSYTDDDFDPRAFDEEKTFNEPVSDIEDEDDPFDTSAVQF